MKTCCKCAVIIVTNNSEKHIDKAIHCLKEQTVPPEQIIVVDTGSNDTNYLLPYGEKNSTQLVIAKKGIGFCRGNNIGMAHVSESCKYVFFLNPDAFLTHTFLERAIQFMENPANQTCGALTGITLGYDITQNLPTGKYDTTGIFRKWYGKWYDRDQGSLYQTSLYQKQEELLAICGAVFFCRKRALDEVSIREYEVFDNSFYMYKEDIDLSFRLRAKQWRLIFLPNLICYHCRGWNSDRKKMAKNLRMYSARNELRIQIGRRSPIPILYSLLKLVMVKIFNW
jgi:N-acetylglucosaminyl-diphospho-decaprenol L-rhamnosyltransferase